MKTKLEKILEHIKNHTETGKIDFAGEDMPYQVVRIDQTFHDLLNS